MTRRKIIRMTMVFLLFGFGHAEARVGAEIVNKPEIVVGDEWISVDLTHKRKIIRKVIEKRGDVYVFEEIIESGRELKKYDDKLNLIGGNKKLDFPLYVGKKWSWKKKHNFFTKVVGNFEVVSKEIHKVPAGSFDSLKIQAVIQPHVLGIRVSLWTGVIEFWYAECAGSVIEVRLISGMEELKEEITPEVMKSFEFHNAPAECAV